MSALCDDCGVDTAPDECIDGTWEWYMVHDEIWAEFGTAEGFLCVGCLENRLGRELTEHDFMEVPINLKSWAQTPRLVSRQPEYDSERADAADARLRVANRKALADYLESHR